MCDRVGAHLRRVAGGLALGLAGWLASVPAQAMDELGGLSRIAAGYEHTCALTTAGGLKCWGWNVFGQLGDGTASQRPVPAPVLSPGPTVIEFYNSILDHYFITASASEAVGIDQGRAGSGWSRTGVTFKSGGSTSACRFYGSLSPGPNSHFYTADVGECSYLKGLQANTLATQKRWNYESLEFLTAVVPVNRTCPPGTTPVYRAYNNGFARGIDSNHRIPSNLAAIQEVVTRGGINEGVVMCAPS